jgi:hypothetical protein
MSRARTTARFWATFAVVLAVTSALAVLVARPHATFAPDHSRRPFELDEPPAGAER